MEIHKLRNNQRNHKYISRIVEVHIKAFPDFFLTQLGKKFLSTLYCAYLEDENSGIIIALDDSKVVRGFIAYSKNYSEFYKQLMKKHLFEFGISSMVAVFRHPSFIKRLLGAFSKSDEVKRKESYVELASIGVDPETMNCGIGSGLISYLKRIVDYDKYDYISLETDAQNNDSVNQFYQKNGFVLDRQYVTPQGRKMNEYHYYKEKG